MEKIKVREKTDTRIVFASMDDMTKFFDQIFNGQGVIFDYVDKDNVREGEYVSPAIMTPINDGKIIISSKEPNKEKCHK